MTFPPAEDPPPRTRFYRLFARYVAFSERHARGLCLAFAALTLVCLVPVSQLELHTDLAELLPTDHPAVRALRGISGRQKSATNLVMLVHSPSSETNVRFAEALRPELEKLIPTVFTEIQWRPEVEIPEYASRWRWLYADKKDLESAQTLLDRIIAVRSSPLMVDLEGNPEDELKSMRERLSAKLPPKKESKYFEGVDGKTPYLGVMMWRRRDGLATQGDRETLKTVQEVVRRLNPASFDPQLEVEYTGQIGQAIDESNGIRDDLTVATVVCSSLVLFAIYLYFRRVALIFVIGAPAVQGMLLSLVLAWATIHYLNINTAFLISIILGNGINSPIVLLARYGEERRQSRPPAQALLIAMDGTLLGTGTAMAAASIAYGSLLLTSFRGFNQFGLIGFAGMLMVWILSFLMVPPLVIMGERLWPGRLTPGRNLWRIPFAWIGQLCTRRPILPATLALVLVAVAAVPLWRFTHDPLEWNFDNLRTDDTPSQHLWPIMEKLGMGDVGAGYIGNDGVLLVDRPEQADPVAEAMRKKDAALGPRHVLKTVRTVSSVLPADQKDKLEILGQLRARIDKHRDLMNADEWREVSQWRPPDYLRPLTVADLPRQVREAFTEVDGQFGRLIGIDADSQTFYGWNGHDLLRISEALTVDALGKTWVAASAATVFAGMLDSIIRDGPQVTLAALGGVVVLVLIAFRLSGALPVLGSLAIGLVWLGGLAWPLHLKLNFMNFVAVPITLGVGADYAANIWARLRADGVARLPQVIADTGSAVALCSTTTIIGYSSLLVSHNRALRSFGKLADLGEITCLIAALIALPALLQVVGQRKSRASSVNTAVSE